MSFRHFDCCPDKIIGAVIDAMPTRSRRSRRRTCRRSMSGQAFASALHVCARLLMRQRLLTLLLHRARIVNQRIPAHRPICCPRGLGSLTSHDPPFMGAEVSTTSATMSARRQHRRSGRLCPLAQNSTVHAKHRAALSGESARHWVGARIHRWLFPMGCHMLRKARGNTNICIAMRMWGGSLAARSKRSRKGGPPPPHELESSVVPW